MLMITNLASHCVCNPYYPCLLLVLSNLPSMQPQADHVIFVKRISGSELQNDRIGAEETFSCCSVSIPL